MRCLQETHCVTFDVFQPKEETGDFGLNSTVLPVTTSTVLNVYLQDNWVKNQKQSIWNSSNLTKNKWETVQLALTPKAYKVVIVGDAFCVNKVLARAHYLCD